MPACIPPRPVLRSILRLAALYPNSQLTKRQSSFHKGTVHTRGGSVELTNSAGLNISSQSCRDPGRGRCMPVLKRQISKHTSNTIRSKVDDAYEISQPPYPERKKVNPVT